MSESKEEFYCVNGSKFNKDYFLPLLVPVNCTVIHSEVYADMKKKLAAYEDIGSVEEFAEYKRRYDLLDDILEKSGLERS